MQKRVMWSAALATALIWSVGCAGEDRGHAWEDDDETDAEDHETMWTPPVTSADAGNTAAGNTMVGTGNTVSGSGSTTLGGSVPSETITGSGHTRAEPRSVNPFTRVVNDSALPVQVRKGEHALTVEIDDNLLPYVETVVRDDTLTVRTTMGFHFDRAITGPFVLITLPNLASASAESSGSLDVSAEDASQTITLGAQSSGNLTFQGEASQLVVESASTGRVRLAGAARRLDITSLGNGGVDAAQLQAMSGVIRHEGNGKVSATITGTVDVTSLGNGDVKVSGGASPGVLVHEGSGQVSIQ
jgi:hypothetical protein